MTDVIYLVLCRPPLSNGTLAGKTWTRRFGFGTTVTFNAETGKGTIAWGSFPGDEPATGW